MTTSVAYFGKKDVQAKYVSRVQTHYELDEIVKGRYWEGGKGLRCLGARFTFPARERFTPIRRLQVAGLVDVIFENLPDEQAKDWPLAVVTAPKLGADLSQVWPQFAIWLMTDAEFGVENTTTDPEIKALCREVAEGYRTGQTTGPQAKALADRLRAAWAAWAAFVVASADTLLLLLTEAPIAKAAA